MPQTRQPRPEDQPLAERVVPTISETGEGIPDDAIGPGQRSVPEQLDLGGEAGGRGSETPPPQGPRDRCAVARPGVDFSVMQAT